MKQKITVTKKFNAKGQVIEETTTTETEEEKETTYTPIFPNVYPWYTYPYYQYAMISDISQWQSYNTTGTYTSGNITSGNITKVDFTPKNDGDDGAASVGVK